MCIINKVIKKYYVKIKFLDQIFVEHVLRARNCAKSCG